MELSLEAVKPEHAKGHEAGLEAGMDADRGSIESDSRDRDRSSRPELEPDRDGRGVDRDHSLWTDGIPRASGTATKPRWGAGLSFIARRKLAMPSFRRGLSCFWGPESDAFRLSR